MVGLENKGFKTIHGIVIPAEWDHEGSVTSVDIMGRDESSYRVENIASARGLLKFLQQEVTATGKIKELSTGKFEIRIVDYKLPNPLSNRNA
ncbi:MAG TPA: hypothetical protein HPQ03_00580 [Deltaproteobacteria bacterium]|nr:hypothetical protein [Deltaproteobacteria bacterium]